MRLPTFLVPSWSWPRPLHNPIFGHGRSVMFECSDWMGKGETWQGPAVGEAKYNESGAI